MKPEPGSPGVVYRGSTSTDLSPELLARLRNAGLACTRREIDERCKEAPGIVDELLRRSHPLRWLVRLTYFSRALGQCTLADIPRESRNDAAGLGFRPLVWMIHGPPVFPIRTPNFIGPEGFVKLEVFGRQRIYLFTYFDDGTQLETAPGAAVGARTKKLTGTDDLSRDYAAHLERALEIVRERGCSPIYRGTPATLARAWRLYPAYFAPAMLHLFFVFATLWPLWLVLYHLLRKH